MDPTPAPSKLKDLFQDELPVSLVFSKARHNAALSFKITATVVEEETKRLQFLLSGGFDPQLLWKCEISAQDYPVFRAQQNLLVDFEEFPLQVIEILKEATSQNQPKCLCQLREIREPSFQFDIIEPNRLRHLVHLSLLFTRLTNAEIKDHFAALFKQALERGHKGPRDPKEQFAFQEDDNRNSTERDITVLEERVARLQAELRQMQETRAEELSQQSQKFSESVNRIKGEAERERREALQKLAERDKECLELKQKMDQPTRGDKFEEISRQQQAQILRLEQSLQQASREITKGNDIIQKLQSEIREMKGNESLHAKIAHNQEKLLREQEARAASLAKQLDDHKNILKSKEDEVIRLHSTLNSLKDQLSSDRNMIALLSRQVDRKFTDVLKDLPDGDTLPTLRDDFGVLSLGFDQKPTIPGNYRPGSESDYPSLKEQYHTPRKLNQRPPADSGAAQDLRGTSPARPSPHFSGRSGKSRRDDEFFAADPNDRF